MPRIIAAFLLLISSLCFAQDDIFADSFDYQTCGDDVSAVRSNLGIVISAPQGSSDLKLRASIDLPVIKGAPIIGALVGQGGTAPYVFSEITSNWSGVGITVNSDGSITGTPNAIGVVNARVQVQDAALGVYQCTFSINVIPDFYFIADTPPVAVTGYAYVYQFRIGGNVPTYPSTFAAGIVAGSLPAGLTIDGLISGGMSPNGRLYAFTTVAATPGEYDFTYRVTNGAGDFIDAPVHLIVDTQGTVTFDNTINPGPGGLGGTWLPPAIVGVPYKATVSVTDGVAPFTFNDTNGVIKSLGLSVNPYTGEVSGTVTDQSLAGSYDSPYLVEVGGTDSAGIGMVTSQAVLAVLLTAPSTDGTLAANSDQLTPTQAAVKSYVDAHAGGGSTHANVGSSATLSKTINRYTAGSVHGTTPASPADFDQLEIRIEDASFTGCTLIANSGQTVNGAASYSFDILPCIFRFTYNLSATNWFIDYYRIGSI